MRTLVILLAAVFVGCGGTSTSSTTGDATVGLGQDVTSTVDAAATDIKNGDIEAAKCVGAKDKHACDTFDECASGEYCDPCTKVCKKSREVCDPCTQDAECGGAENGSICIPYDKGGTFCGQACVGDAGCPKAFTCKAVGGSASKQCVPKSGSCAAGSGLCKLDTDCPFQFVCNADYGVCVMGCTNDLSCPQPVDAPTVCSLGHCVSPCTQDSECAPLNAEAKCLKQRCSIPGGCLNSMECPAKQHCALGLHKCQPGCQIDADCQDAALKCEGDQCVVKGCVKNFECSFGKICNPGTGLCEDPTLPYCGPCDDQDQDVKACNGKPAICSKTKDSAGTEFGPFCFLPCSEDPTGPCPQGYGCQEVKDDKGVVQAKVCFRQCQYQPQTSAP